ncbi:MAG: hypothetical protein AAF605_09060 [Myxococcota bacterium]
MTTGLWTWPGTYDEAPLDFTEGHLKAIRQLAVIWESRPGC